MKSSALNLEMAVHLFVRLSNIKFNKLGLAVIG